eukprot:TRINITY_DN12514_c0_g1_i2.p1 TRINITY_DN12514_c0_g1~~TRINITY_DN12514_c0_g1_i2.p1  ORF type:complete len:123 (-),score=23.05 TRINITY_DN12514_c0_g1_i2:225-593(-)
MCIRDRHVLSIEPCLENPTASACSARGTREEVQDIRGYHSFLGSHEAERCPFATLVILHNLVSSSIPEEFQRDRGPVFFCVKDAVDLIAPELRPDGFSPRLPVLPDGVQLPGVGLHRLIDCS